MLNPSEDRVTAKRRLLWGLAVVSELRDSGTPGVILVDVRRILQYLMVYLVDYSTVWYTVVGYGILDRLLYHIIAYSSIL